MISGKISYRIISDTKFITKLSTIMELAYKNSNFCEARQSITANSGQMFLKSTYF